MDGSDGLARMIALAAAARENAHAPYSNFKVGACLRGESGRLFAGCNVENASYPESQCAEATALGSLVSAGDKRVLECVVMAEGDDTVMPCGGCCQRLGEFAAPDAKIHLCDGKGVRRTVTLCELLPLTFGRANLKR
jgi:cytidine deaminase